MRCAAPGRVRYVGQAAAPGRGEAVLCPPPRAARSETLETWWPANGREDLLGEWDDPGVAPHEVTHGS